MTSADLANLVIGLIALIFIVVRQWQVRPLETDMRLPLTFAAIGLFQLIQFLHRGDHGTEVFAVLVGSSVLAVVFAAVRSASVHVWFDSDEAWRQGNWRTAIGWVFSFGAHLGYDFIVDGRGANAGLGSASALLYFAVTCAVQRLIVQARAKSVAAAQSGDPDTHITVRWP